MKKSELSFFGADIFEKQKSIPKGTQHMAFDWDKAAEIIKENLSKYPDLVAEAGLQGDWAYTGGVIFENGFPTNEEYTYLCSNWATPTLIIMNDGSEVLEVACFCDESDRFSDKTKWDETSLGILGISLDDRP